MSNKKIISFIDLDSVCVNFNKSACKKISKYYSEIPYPSNYQFPSDKWLYDECEKNNVDKKQFWEIINGEDFWENLEIYPWTKKIIEIVENNSDNWMFLSKPSRDAGSWSGKYKWVQKHFGEGKLWLVADHKEYAANSTNILIDDKKENCEKWASFGGFSYHWSEVTDDFNPNEINKRLTEIENLIKHVRWYNNQ